jgi:mono/diheme cytochrome c family protein
MSVPLMNPLRTRTRVLAVLLPAFFAVSSLAADPAGQADHRGPACVASDDYFLKEVWTKVAAQACIECHKAGGDAEESDFILQDPAKDAAPDGRGSLQENYAAFARMAAVRKGGESRLLLKATGGLNHEGEEVLKRGSTGHRILAEFVRRVTGSAEENATTHGELAPADAAKFFEGITMLDDRRLLRRLTLSLAGRLPRAEEVASVREQGLGAIGPVLDGVMKEEAFYVRLGEAFNDIFLVRGYGDGAESALAYEHFEKTRHWTQKHDLSGIAEEKAREKARYKLADDYREALLREPLELVKYIVRNDRPFTEVLTADFIMVSPYTSRGYGNHEEIRERFQNPEDPYEFVPVRLASLRHRDDRGHQESATGFYPHAGMLSTFQYLRRYPTTETNRNRLRARMFYQHFLGVDVLELAARVNDAAAVTAKYEVPTMQAAECVVCHKTLDPAAGIFQDFYSLEGVFGPRKDGWYKDMFRAGFEGEELPAEERWRALQWLGERTVRDPRFARTMVEHVLYVLTGRKALLAPKGIDDPLFDARQRAYLAQRQEIERIAAQFVAADFNLKVAFKEWAVSPFYRADGVAMTAANPERQTELADLGLARMLGPEQLERKIAAVFGKPWGRLDEGEAALLYGGIDSQEVTERAADPSGAMGALQRTMANEVACKNVATDFAKAPQERLLFPNIEQQLIPGESPEGDQRIRDTVVHLHELVLGRNDPADGPEITRTVDLFTGIVRDARERENVDPRESYFCRAGGEARVKDESYTLRAWRAVLTYLLRQRDFLYE